MVQLLIYVFENIEDDLYLACGLSFVAFDRFDGDFGSTVVREHEYTRGDAAKCDAFHIMFVGNLQAGAITGSKQFFVMLRQSALYDPPTV